MSIKSVLLSSAAVFISTAVSHAADAVVLEAEPIEYVRVCDAYGSGYFFIPGTETCIRFGGYVRSGYESFSVDGTVGGSLNGNVATDDPTFNLWGQRGRLNIDVRNETDWGTLRSVYRLEGGQSNVDANIDLDVALISLAGFRAGFAGANYWSTNHGFGGVSGEDLATNAGGILYEQGFYGFDDATIFDYTFAQDGLAITVGVEDPRISFGGDAILNNTNNGGSDDGANFYAGINYTGDFGTFAATAVHDTLAFELDGAGNRESNDGGWAYKVSLELDLSEFRTGTKLSGYYLYDGDYNTDYVNTYRISENPESIYGIAFQTDLTDEFEFWINYWEAEGGEAVDGAGIQFTEGDTTQAGIGLNWYPNAAPQFHVKTSYILGNVENSGSVLFSSGDVPRADFDFDFFSIALRRDF